LASTACIDGAYVLSGECKKCTDTNAKTCPGDKANVCKNSVNGV